MENRQPLLLQDEEKSINIGHWFRSMRESKYLTIDEVAGILCLKKEWIRHIENDNYSGLPKMPYLKGYLCAYAKLLGLSENRVLKAFEMVELNHTQPLYFPVRLKKQTCAKDKSIRFTTYSIISLLFILVGLWWKSDLGTITYSASMANEGLSHERVENSMIEKENYFTKMVSR